MRATSPAASGLDPSEDDAVRYARQMLIPAELLERPALGTSPPQPPG